MIVLPDGTAVENWTAHEVVLLTGTESAPIVILQEPEAPIRLSTTRERLGPYLWRVAFAGPEKLPAWKPGVYYIVSVPVKLALAGTGALLVTPNELIRDAHHNVVGCRSFAL